MNGGDEEEDDRVNVLAFYRLHSWRLKLTEQILQHIQPQLLTSFPALSALSLSPLVEAHNTQQHRQPNERYATAQRTSFTGGNETQKRAARPTGHSARAPA